MSASRSRSVRIAIIAAVGLVVVLAGALAARLLGHSGADAYAMAAPPAATVPAPHPCDLAKLELPCWGCIWAAELAAALQDRPRHARTAGHGHRQRGDVVCRVRQA